MAGLYGNLLDPETEKALRGQALLQFGANLLSAQPTPYPQGTLSTIGGALSNTLPMVNQQAQTLMLLKQRQQEQEARRAEEERKASKPIIQGGMVFDQQGNLQKDYRMSDPLQKAKYELDAAQFELQKQEFQLKQMQAGQLTPYQQAELDMQKQRIKLEYDKLAAGGERGQIGTVSPGDYTPESVAKFKQTGDYNDLKRYAPSLDVEAQQNVAQAKKLGTVMGGAQGQATIDLPKITQQAAYSKRLLGELMDHPGFETSVGLKGPSAWAWGGKPVPGTPAAGFEERRAQLQGQQFLEAYQTLKGGGQITEVEGQKAEKAIARMGTAQSEEEFKSAARDFMDIIDMGVARATQMSSGNFSPMGGTPPISPVQVNSPADVEALPPGTVFLTPDGRRKVKP